MVSAAVYLRLSDEDRNKKSEADESESIQNQKSLLTDYCRQRNWDIFDIYCDEDYSGTDFYRPDFQRMLADCESGCINVVLCKSQSRFSRDMAVVETYIHDKFPEWGVRFVSIIDHADSLDVTNKKTRQINGLVNEWYCEEVSANVRKVLQHKREEGKFTGSFAPYGYLVDPEDKNHLIIDEMAAPVVRDIFSWYLQGWGYRKIAAALNEAGIPNPTSHKSRTNSRYVNSNESKSSSKGLWTVSTIYNIIRNETYTGTLVQGKSHTVSYKNKKRKRAAEEEWIKISGSHDAVIDAKTWEMVRQKLKSRVRAGRTDQELSPLAGKVKCAVCGKPMKRNVYYNKKKTIRYYSLICGTYKTGAMNCSNKASISGMALERLLLEQINKLIENYCQQDKINVVNGIDESISRLIKLSESICRDVSENDEKLIRLYEDKLDGTISKEQYIMMSRRYTDKIEGLKARKESIRQSIEELEEKRSATEKRDMIIDRYSRIEKLTRTVAEEFIESVLIGEKNESGQREITINWNL